MPLYPGSPQWINATLSAGWLVYGGNYSSPQYSISDSGLVRLRGLVKAVSASPPALILTLPTGFRPQFWHLFWVPAGSSSTGGNLYALTDGSIQVASVPSPQNFVSLEAISFYAA